MKSTLFARWVVINSVLVALFVVAYYYHLLDRFLADDTYMTHGISALVGLFVLFSGWVAYQIQSEWKTVFQASQVYLAELENNRGDDYKEFLSNRLQSRLAVLRIAGPILVAFGLLGTVIGISIAFSGITPDVISDVSASQGVMATLLAGLATAFHTTLAGIVGMIWNIMNLHLLNQDSSRLYTNITCGTKWEQFTQGNQS